MEAQIKAQSLDPSFEKLSEKEQKTDNAQDITEAFQAFEKLIKLFKSQQVQLKLEDIQELRFNDLICDSHLLGNNGKVFLKLFRYKNSKVKRNWYQNQLRIFIWILFNYSQAKHRPIQTFKAEQWELIAKAFFGKTVEDIKFEWYLLSKCACPIIPWTKQEDTLIKTLMNQIDYQNKWIDIAKILYQNSDFTIFRKPKQCRERWKNYLNPNIQKGQWSLIEDKKLFELILQFGKKWSNISKSLETRTEHSVKNRYKSLLKKFKKDHNIRQKPKSAKGLHTKELDYINKMIEEINQKLDYKNSESNQSQRKEEQPQARQELVFDRFYPISPNSAWKYCDKPFPAILTVIQSPKIISPHLMSPSFCFARTAWSQQTNKLFLT